MGSKHACACVCVCVGVGVGETLCADSIFRARSDNRLIKYSMCSIWSPVYVYQAASLCPVYEGQHVRMTESVNIDHLRRFRLGLVFFKNK